ncbi:hypothetical protein [Alloactinosynnema sp. L-07]|uniref:hypothetical protein n=1 Tax=Alloactinosynnema sp. L-07 TaxID=1653480 RepID=UPI00065EF088|nr:hypothetical protein [Alloactinosynnema sp. L-07]CRK56884.1 hypothetical protein [Alloactinosynnema sp. L-07]
MNDIDSIPSAHELRITDLGTPQAAWVVGAEHDETVGFTAEGSLPITGEQRGEPDQAVADWVSDVIEVEAVVFVADPVRPLVWLIRYTA